MASLNSTKKSAPIFTHEGAKAKHINFEQELRRSVFATFLWEDQFYESGISIADRIRELVPKVNAQKVSEIAIEARTIHNLRHVPLLIVREMARTNSHKNLVADTLEKIICRADELTEFVAIYWKEKRQPLSAQVKKGLARAFGKFSEYQLARNNQKKEVSLRDVLFLCHAKPKNEEQEIIWKKLINNELSFPESWQTELSSGKDKNKVWSKMISEKKLGALDVLKNLRNMQDAKVDRSLIKKIISETDYSKVLPFRFVSAARFAPDFESDLETAMFKNLSNVKKLDGKTLILVDVSGSMESPISSKSDLKRIDAGCALAMIVRELCDDVVVYSFSNQEIKVPNRRGFALRDSIINSQMHSGTYLGRSLSNIQSKETYDRIIVITDEQSADRVPDPIGKHNYLVNVAACKNGIGYGKWTHIDGFSEGVVKYIQEFENLE